jgi:hypothetical protein
VAIYQVELEKEPTEEKKGRQVVCREVEKAYLTKTGRVIKLSDGTLANLAKGGRRLVMSWLGLASSRSAFTGYTCSLAILAS